MKSRFVASMAALLAGTGLALAQSAGKTPQTTATAAAAPDVVNKIVNTELPPMERPVTPYWPNPVGPQQCALPGMLPGAPSKTAPGDGTEAFWASAEYLYWKFNNLVLVPACLRIWRSALGDVSVLVIVVRSAGLIQASMVIPLLNARLLELATEIASALPSNDRPAR